MIYTNLLYSSNGPSIPVEDKIFLTEGISLEVALMWILCGNENTTVKTSGQRASVQLKKCHVYAA